MKLRGRWFDSFLHPLLILALSSAALAADPVPEFKTPPRRVPGANGRPVLTLAQVGAYAIRVRGIGDSLFTTSFAAQACSGGKCTITVDLCGMREAAPCNQAGQCGAYWKEAGPECVELEKKVGEPCRTDLYPIGKKGNRW